MNEQSSWKEQFHEIIKSYEQLEKKGWIENGSISETINWEEIKNFISTEIIEQIFTEFQQLVSDGHCSLNPELKQLRDKWL